MEQNEAEWSRYVRAANMETQERSKMRKFLVNVITGMINQVLLAPSRIAFAALQLPTSENESSTSNGLLDALYCVKECLLHPVETGTVEAIRQSLITEAGIKLLHLFFTSILSDEPSEIDNDEGLPFALSHWFAAPLDIVETRRFQSAAFSGCSGSGSGSGPSGSTSTSRGFGDLLYDSAQGFVCPEERLNALLGTVNSFLFGALSGTFFYSIAYLSSFISVNLSNKIVNFLKASPEAHPLAAAVVQALMTPMITVRFHMYSQGNLVEHGGAPLNTYGLLISSRVIRNLDPELSGVRRIARFYRGFPVTFMSASYRSFISPRIQAFVEHVLDSFVNDNDNDESDNNSVSQVHRDRHSALGILSLKRKGMWKWVGAGGVVGGLLSMAASY